MLSCISLAKCLSFSPSALMTLCSMFCFVKFIIPAAALTPPTDDALNDVLVLNFSCITFSSSSRASG